MRTDGGCPGGTGGGTARGTCCTRARARARARAHYIKVTGSGLAEWGPAQLQTAHETTEESADDMDPTAELTTTIPVHGAEQHTTQEADK